MCVPPESLLADPVSQTLTWFSLTLTFDTFNRQSSASECCVHATLTFSRRLSIQLNNLSPTILSPRRFLSHTYLSLPHLPCQLPLCASICPVLQLRVRRRIKKVKQNPEKHKNRSLNPSTNRHNESQTAPRVLSFILRPYRLQRDIWGSDVGGGWKRSRCENVEVCRKRESRVFTSPPEQWLTEEREHFCWPL